MKVLVTGSAGYIGSVLCRELLRRGHSVIGVDNLHWGQPAQPIRIGGGSPPRILEHYRIDARRIEDLKRWVRKCDVIIPLAAIVGAPACDANPVLAERVNFWAVSNLMEVLSPHHAVIIPNTNSGYGTRSGDIFCTEETPLEPVSLYGRTKADAEKVVLQRGNSVSLRLATVFGPSPRMRFDLLVNTMVLEAMLSGKITVFGPQMRRNFIHVIDVAECICWLLDNWDVVPMGVYNLGNDDLNMTKLELAEAVAGYVWPLHYDNRVVIGQGEDPDKRDYIVSNEKLRTAGFQACRGLGSGVPEIIDKVLKMKAEYGDKLLGPGWWRNA